MYNPRTRLYLALSAYEWGYRGEAIRELTRICQKVVKDDNHGPKKESPHQCGMEGKEKVNAC